MAASELTCQPQDVTNAWPQFANLPPYEQTSLINVASQAVVNYCRRNFGQQTYNDYLDGRNTATLYLSQKPVVSVSQIVVNADPSVPGSGWILTNADGNDWVLYPTEGKIVRGPSIGIARFNWWFPMGTRNVVVTYWAGYSTIPDPVTRATVLMVKYLHDLTRFNPLFQSKSLGDYSYTLGNLMSITDGTTVPGYVADLLAPYVQDGAIVFI